MILVLLMVSRVMKSKSTQLVAIMVSTTGQVNIVLILIIQPQSEEDLRCSRDHAKDVMVPFIRNTIYWLIRVSSKENLWIKWYLLLVSIQLIKNIKEITSRNGIIDKELFMIECGHHISPCIKLRMLMVVCGLRICLEQSPITQAW